MERWGARCTTLRAALPGLCAAPLQEVFKFGVALVDVVLEPPVLVLRELRDCEQGMDCDWGVRQRSCWRLESYPDRLRRRMRGCHLVRGPLGVQRDLPAQEALPNGRVGRERKAPEVVEERLHVRHERVHRAVAGHLQMIDRADKLLRHLPHCSRIGGRLRPPAKARSVQVDLPREKLTATSFLRSSIPDARLRPCSRVAGTPMAKRASAYGHWTLYCSTN